MGFLTRVTNVLAGATGSYIALRIYFTFARPSSPEEKYMDITAVSILGGLAGMSIFNSTIFILLAIERLEKL